MKITQLKSIAISHHMHNILNSFQYIDLALNLNRIGIALVTFRFT